MQMLTLAKLGLIFVPAVLAACANKKSGSGKDSPTDTSTESLGNENVSGMQSSEILTVRIAPFGNLSAADSSQTRETNQALEDATPGNGKVNLAWIAPTGKTLAEVLHFAPPATAEGFHWKWQFRKPVLTFVSNAPLGMLTPENALFPWESVGEIDSTELLNASNPASGSDSSSDSNSGSELNSKLLKSGAVGFHIDFQKPPESSSWPAVVGLGNADAHAFSFLALSPVMPSSVGAPIRLEIDTQALEGRGLSASDIENIQFVSRAKSCGRFCFEFENYLAAMDTPVFVARSAANLFDKELKVEEASLGKNDVQSATVRMLAIGANADQTASESVSSRPELCADSWSKVLANSLKLRNLFSSYWGTPHLIKERFDIYLMQLASGISYQGLEHSGSTLVVIGGDCNAAGFQWTASSLMAHEIAHVWNVRHLFPAEHANYSAASFDAARTTQLYFYEGFTEGFARVARSELGFDDAPPSGTVETGTLQAWNNSLSALYQRFEKLPEGQALQLNVSDPNDAFGQYNTGSGFLLFLALKLRVQNDENAARIAFWSMLEKIREKSEEGQETEKRAFVLPPWVRRVWTGLEGKIAEGYGGGYSSAQVHGVLVDTVGQIEGSQSTDGVTIIGIKRSELEATLNSFAQTTGMTLRFSQRGQLLFSTDSNRVWPFSK